MLTTASCRPSCFAGPAHLDRPRHGCWLQAGLSCRITTLYIYRAAQLACRASLADSAEEWSPPPAAGSSGGTSGGRPLALLDDALLQASQELQELCLLQLQLLATALRLSLQAGLSSGGGSLSSGGGSLSSGGGSLSSGSIEEDQLRQQWLTDSSCLRCSVYCRAPGSLQTGQLQLQLVAMADREAGGGGGASSAAAHAQQAQRAQQQAQRFLFLGEEGMGGSMHDQEQWILEQPVIVLPDSGGLVLPLAHNGFLVGLLVVEQCLEEGAPSAAGAGAAAGMAASATGGAAGGNGSSGSPSGSMPQPPTCLLFRAAELQLLKRTAAALSLACAMDLRAALERVGAAYRQRQASALVQAAKKPLSMMRTLGMMLLPRLQPGEPDRDFAQGILEQGSRLQDVVSQLQAALHPAAAAAAVPPALQQPQQQQQGRGGSDRRKRRAGDASRQRQALPGGGSSSGSGGAGGSSSSSSITDGSSSGQWQLAEARNRPALPSSSIGCDYQWGSTIDMSIDEQPAARLHSSISSSSSSGGVSSSWVQPGGSSSSILSSNISSSSSNGGSGTSFDTGTFSGPSGANGGGGGGSSSNGGAALVYGSAASADLLNVLMPLLASASNFAAVSGVGFVLVEHGGSSSSSTCGSTDANGSSPAATSSSGSSSSSTSTLQQQQVALPAADVAVGPGKLKRMLSQLIDGVIACAARGDLVQASVLPQQWQGRAGVAISLCCCYSLAHGGSSSGGGGVGHLPRPPLQPEFAFLQGSASEAGGWFEVHTDATPDVQHLNSSALAATLWLPTVAAGGSGGGGQASAGWQ